MERAPATANPGDKPLTGVAVLVTRAGRQAETLVRQLEAAGARALELPTIEILPPENFSALDAAVEDIATYDWVIFTSVNSIPPFLERLQRAGKNASCLAALQIGAIGPETAKRLEASGIRTTLVPARYQAEGILDAIPADLMRGKRVLIPRAAEAREILPQALRAWGASVDVVVAYRTMLPNVDVAPVRQMFRRGEIDAVTFTSSSTVKNFVRLFGGGTLGQIVDGSLVACIGPITAKTVEEQGGHPAIIAGEFTTGGLTRALVEHFRAHPRKRVSRPSEPEDL